MHRAKQRDFERVPGSRRLGDVFLRILEQLEDTGELRRIVPPRRLGKAAKLVIRQFLPHLRKRRQDEVARMRGELICEPLEVGARLVRAHDSLQRGARVPPQHRRDDSRHDAAIERAQRLRRLLLADLAARSVRGEELIEERERIAHRALRLLPDERQRSVGDGDALGLRDLAKPRDDLPERNELEVVPLHAAQDGRRQLLRIGRREQELDVPGRLLERLEERIEGGTAEHVHFVDDVDLVAVSRGQILRRLAQGAHVVDAVVGSGVDLLDVDVVALRDLDARAALPARLGRGAFLAVERAGEDARGGRLPAAARAGEEEGVGHAAALERVRQGADDVLLPRQIGKALRAVLPGEDEVRSRHLGGTLRGAGPETGHTDESRYRCSLPGLAGSRSAVARSPVQRPERMQNGIS